MLAMSFYRLSLLALLTSLLTLGLSGCEDLFGSKDDPTVNEVLNEGAVDPTLIPQDVGYVPVFPVWDYFSRPRDVFVGYDEMVYVVDDNGLNVLDQTGTLYQTIPFEGAVEVTQNRRLVTYVTGRVDTAVAVRGDTQVYRLPAIYALRFASTPDYEYLDTLVHPFDDGTRYTQSRILQPVRPDDLEVAFHGIDITAEGEIYVARTGPNNDPTASFAPDNAILFYDRNRQFRGIGTNMSPTQGNLRSVVGVTGLATFAGPPQRQVGMDNSPDFVYCQATQEGPVDYRVLWIREVFDEAAAQTNYLPNQDLLAQDTTQGDRFLYEVNRFRNPRDVYIAPDEPGYIYVVDAGLDSVFVFNQSGVEGVNPPPTANTNKQAKVSFGGTGSGPSQFNDPSGVCYNRGTIYIADKGNNRVIRYRLNTDLE